MSNFNKGDRVLYVGKKRKDGVDGVGIVEKVLYDWQECTTEYIVRFGEQHVRFDDESNTLELQRPFNYETEMFERINKRRDLEDERRQKSYEEKIKRNYRALNVILCMSILMLIFLLVCMFWIFKIIGVLR